MAFECEVGGALDVDPEVTPPNLHTGAMNAETDRVYLDTPGRCAIEDRGWRRRVVIEKVGAASSVV